MKLHLGCGNDPKDGWVNLDLFAGEGVDVVHNLDSTDRLPFDDDTFDEMLGLHVIEHITNPLPMMDELYRVAKPGCALTFACPHGASDDAYEDQTHVRRYFEGSWIAFSAPYRWRAPIGYGFDWQPDEVELQVERTRFTDVPLDITYSAIRGQRNIVVQMVATLRAVKPARAEELALMEQPKFGIALVDLSGPA